jgi:CBS-domain-containing membrane protein
MPTDHLPLSDAGPAVRDAMLFEPRATPASTSLAEARETFANPRVKLLLVVGDDGRFAGTLMREDLPADGDGAIGDLVRPDTPRIAPEAPVAAAVEMLEGTGTARLPVVDDDGTLLGLVCWDREGQQFCVDPGRVT